MRLIWGWRDNFAGVGVGERAAALLAQGDLHVVEGGHLPWLTSPAKVASLAHDFLAQPAAVPV